jgi:hypothetical protein
MAIGGGGGPGNRNDFVFELGVPFTLLFADLVRLTATPYAQVYTDRLCPQDRSNQPDGCITVTDPTQRFAGFRMMLQAALEIVVHPHVNIFFIFEGDPVGQRNLYKKAFTPYLFDNDPQIYGRAGVTFKF